MTQRTGVVLVAKGATAERVVSTQRAVGAWVGRVDVELDFVAVGVVEVHAFGGGVVELVEDDDAGGLEFVLDGFEVVE